MSEGKEGAVVVTKDSIDREQERLLQEKPGLYPYLARKLTEAYMRDVLKEKPPTAEQIAREDAVRGLLTEVAYGFKPDPKEITYLAIDERMVKGPTRASVLRRLRGSRKKDGEDFVVVKESVNGEVKEGSYVAYAISA